jgi:Mrp family chromosome partitioning ATPase
VWVAGGAGAEQGGRSAPSSRHEPGGDGRLLAYNVSAPSDGLQGRSRLEKRMHKWLDGSDDAERRLKYVMWGPGGVGKSTLALKFAAGAVAGGCGWCSGQICNIATGAARARSRC